MKKKIVLLLTALLLLSSCNLNPSTTDTPAMQIEDEPSEVVSIQEEELSTSTNTTERELSDITIEKMRQSDVEARLGKLEPEMEVDNITWYENNQKTFFREIDLANGDKRHLTGIATVDDSWNYNFTLTIADTNAEGFVYLPTWEAKIEDLGYQGESIEDSGEITMVTNIPDPEKIEWINSDYFYIASFPNAGIFEGATGELISSSQDPQDIYSKVEGMGRAYLQPVAGVTASNEALYYIGFRDPELLNRKGNVYELSLTGERLLTEDAMYVIGVSDQAVVFAREIPGKEDQIPGTNGLCYYDLATNQVVEIFMDVYYILDDKYNTSGGQILGNNWADKVWMNENEEYTIKDGVLTFYLSRIADNEMDKYTYTFATQTLDKQETITMS